MLLLLLITPGQNRGDSKFSSISREYFCRAIKVILPELVFDFTVAENVKYCLGGSMTFVCNKGTQGGGLQKRNMCLICIFDH